MTDAAQERQDVPSPRRVASICLEPGTRDVKRALARLYNDLRHGRADAKSVGIAAYVLSVLLKAVEIDVVAARIAAIEARADSQAVPRG